MIVMVKCGVLFEVRTESLNIIYTSFGVEGFIIIIGSTALHGPWPSSEASDS
jgi:hypothetical protein